MYEYGFRCIDNYIDTVNELIAADLTFGTRGYGLSIGRHKNEQS